VAGDLVAHRWRRRLTAKDVGGNPPRGTKNVNQNNERESAAGGNPPPQEFSGADEPKLVAKMATIQPNASPKTPQRKPTSKQNFIPRPRSAEPLPPAGREIFHVQKIKPSPKIFAESLR